FSGHPWSLGGGGASDLRAALEAGKKPLSDWASEVGYTAIIGLDDVYVRKDVGDFASSEYVQDFVVGDDVRDWGISVTKSALFPYDLDKQKAIPLREIERDLERLWPYRTTLFNRPTFAGGTYLSDGRTWWEWHQVTLRRVAKQR